jgi:hypothetical protein
MTGFVQVPLLLIFKNTITFKKLVNMIGLSKFEQCVNLDRKWLKEIKIAEKARKAYK